MNRNIIEYCQKVQEDDALQAAYAGCENTEQMCEIAVEEGRKLGFFFTKEDALATGFSFERLQDAASNDSELSDFELELVAAGLPVNVSGGNGGIPG